MIWILYNEISEYSPVKYIDILFMMKGHFILTPINVHYYWGKNVPLYHTNFLNGNAPNSKNVPLKFIAKIVFVI